MNISLKSVQVNTSIRLNEMMKSIQALKTEFNKEKYWKELKMKWDEIENLINQIRKQRKNFTSIKNQVDDRIQDFKIRSKNNTIPAKNVENKQTNTNPKTYTINTHSGSVGHQEKSLNYGYSWGKRITGQSINQTFKTIE